jgi:hypothetical protein
VPKARLAVGIGVAMVAAIVVVVLLRSGHSDEASSRSEPVRPAARGPVLATLESLRELAGSVGHPIYWAGRRPGDYELTVDVNANIFIRYLQKGVPVGSRRQTSLTVATYPYANAYRTLESASRQPGATAAQTPDGGLVVAPKGSPDNVHIAYSGRDIQIEVYDPKAGRAFELATAGAISRIK